MDRSLSGSREASGGLFLALLQVFFNALLFKDAQSSGLMGGMMVAFGISAVNVLLGVIAGFFARCR